MDKKDNTNEKSTDLSALIEWGKFFLKIFIFSWGIYFLLIFIPDLSDRIFDAYRPLGWIVLIGLFVTVFFDMLYDNWLYAIKKEIREKEE